MGRDRRIIFAALSIALFAACHHDASDSGTTGGASSASAKPVDHLAPGELLEGPEKAFGIALPRDIAVEKRFVDVVYAEGSPAAEPVAKYFSSHVEGGKVTSGSRGTMFDGVHAPGNENVTLRVEVATATDGPFAGRGARVTIRDITAPKQPDLPDESARWNAAGLTPDGKLADPKHMH